MRPKEGFKIEWLNVNQIIELSNLPEFAVRRYLDVLAVETKRSDLFGGPYYPSPVVPIISSMHQSVQKGIDIQPIINTVLAALAAISEKKYSDELIEKTIAIAAVIPQVLEAVQKGMDNMALALKEMERFQKEVKASINRLEEKDGLQFNEAAKKAQHS